MQKNYPRLFIGLDLSSQDKLRLDAWREQYLHGLPDKPVPVENFHITLSFLGLVHPEKMELLDQLLHEIQAEQFSLQTTELGTFKKAQVLYLGLDLPPELELLAKQCRAINKNIEVAQHHSEYRPHITLTRKHKEIMPLSVSNPPLELQFTQFHLFESVSNAQMGKAPHYPKRMSFDLLPKGRLKKKSE